MTKPQISFPDFAKLDLRVGEVKEAEEVKESDHLIRMSVDLGSDYGMRIIFAGVKNLYKPVQLIGKKFIFVANLEPKKMMESESQGMMCAADVEKRAILVPVPKKISVGTIIR